MHIQYGIRYKNGDYDKLWFSSRDEAEAFARRESKKKRRQMALRRERGGTYADRHRPQG